MKVLHISDEATVNTKPIVAILRNTYGNCQLVTSYEVESDPDILRGAGLVVIWWNLDPFFAKRALVPVLVRKIPHVFVETSMVPRQQAGVFAFYNGGPSFACTNLIPQFTTPNYEQNVAHLKQFYTHKRQIPKQKVVVVGQMMLDVEGNEHSMDNMIRKKIRKEYQNWEVVFCRHPKDEISIVKNCPTSTKSTVEECMDASVAVMGYSTMAYELDAYDIDVEFLIKSKAYHPIHRPWTKPLECQATALDYQFNVHTSPDTIRSIIDRLQEQLKTGANK